jgi:hypothetical protein
MSQYLALRVSKTTVKARVKSFGLKRQGEGRKQRGQVPYGWWLFKGKLVGHYGEQKSITKMAARRAEGASFGDLVD